MNRSTLTTQLAAENPSLTREDVARAVAAMLEEIGAALAAGGRVELRGFGAFSVRERRARIGRNPKTGAAVAVAKKAVPFFRSGNEMRARLNAARDD